MNFCWLACLLAVTSPVDATTKDQRVTSGNLQELTAQRTVIAGPTGPVTLMTGDLLEIKPHEAREPAALQPPIEVRLVDGSLFRATDYRVEKGKATIVIDADTRFTLSTRVVDYVRLATSVGPFNQQWLDILKTERTGDTIVVRKTGTLDFVAGVSGDVTDEHVHFNVDGDVVPVKREKIEGMLYFHAVSDELPASFCSVQTLSGAKIEAAALKFDAAGRIEITTPAQASITIGATQWQRIQFKAQYLSDLEPESVVYSRQSWLGFSESLKPHDRSFHRPRFNEGLELGQPLRVGGLLYSKGISLYSGTELSFRLVDTYRELHAVVGIDDRARPRGRVVLKVMGEEKLLAEHTITGRDEPLRLTIPLSGVRRVRIVIGSAGDGDHDRLFFCDPRLVK